MEILHYWIIIFFVFLIPISIISISAFFKKILNKTSFKNNIKYLGNKYNNLIFMIYVGIYITILITGCFVFSIDSFIPANIEKTIITKSTAILIVSFPISGDNILIKSYVYYDFKTVNILKNKKFEIKGRKKRNMFGLSNQNLYIDIKVIEKD